LTDRIIDSYADVALMRTPRFVAYPTCVRLQPRVARPVTHYSSKSTDPTLRAAWSARATSLLGSSKQRTGCLSFCIRSLSRTDTVSLPKKVYRCLALQQRHQTKPQFGSGPYLSLRVIIFVFWTASAGHYGVLRLAWQNGVLPNVAAGAVAEVYRAVQQ
jgi:hypothetical protein